ncbi:MAG: 4Fe-4S binding protein [Desulfobacterales bacterium]
MRTRTARRISQIFFFVLFLWFCAAATLGQAWWQLRGWPVNWLLQLDPLVGLATLLTTGTLFAGLLWGLATLIMTVLLGRFFCGWLCPFGSLHQFAGWLGRRRKPAREKARINQPSRWQAVKYWILIFLLAAAAAGLLDLVLAPPRRLSYFGWAAAAAVAVAALMMVKRTPAPRWQMLAGILLAGCAWVAAGIVTGDRQALCASLLIGLLDPLPLMHRSVNLVLLPLLDEAPFAVSGAFRFYAGAWLIGVIFLAAVFLNLWIPRFYCRFVCPLGALFGLLGRHALWRIGKRATDCTDCHICEQNCEGACAPAGVIRTPECVLCLNCLAECRHGLIGYRTTTSAAGEIAVPDISRRQFVLSAVSGLAAVPLLRLDGQLAGNWNHRLVRPPGAVAEAEFLSRCIKCGQCMRICPTNVIQPGGWQAGIEGLWTPVLDFRVGSSGCQYKCIACSNICPTAALRPLTLDERLGRGPFAELGPIRIGTAFVDRGRCLPWAMDIPCIVCQENCPVSPKAIATRTVFSPVTAAGALMVDEADDRTIRFRSAELSPGRFATGDYYCRIAGDGSGDPRRITANTDRTVTLATAEPPSFTSTPGAPADILIRLQQPLVRPELCIGCGVCEHECPVRGRRAIRVSAENETRNPEHAMTLKG